LRIHIKNVGKQPLEQGGKYRVNENDEELLRSVNFVAVVAKSGRD
jgi:hypothetical protein